MYHDRQRTAQKIAQRLTLIAPLVYRRQQPLPPFRMKTLRSPAKEPLVAPDVDDSGWSVIEPQSYWGDWFTDFMLRTTFQVPDDWAPDAPVALFLPLGDAGDFSHPESLAYVDGKAYAAVDRHHQEILVAPEWRDGQPHSLALHGWTGLGGWEEPEAGTKLFMRTCAVVQVDQPTRDFVAAARVALETVAELDANDPVRDRLLNALDEAFKILDTRVPLEDAFYASVGPALEALRAGVASAGEPLDVDVVAVGHAHIDVAWLWTLDHTRRKAGRTFSTVLRLMEQFPDYHFTQSQPQLYQYLEEDYPDLFAQIKQRVAEGRWELIGGSWVEPDCNESGAEALARQFLLGRNYFRRHFGDVDTPVFWLPDTFGYPWALPQLIKLAGLKYFVTHKMSWNQFNRMPYQSFWWQGLDGTRILTQFMTTPDPHGLEWNLPHSTTYNGDLSPKQVLGTWTNYQHKETHAELMTVYGYGDGGGGPTREMLENSRVLADHPGMPRLRPGTVRETLDNLAAKAADQLPTWHGELYLEYHRGTLTSQGKTKRQNRKSEILLHDAEFLAALASLTTDFVYPHETLNQAWELVCLNQFHDILPGSSITPVYVDSDRDHAEVRKMGGSVREQALAALGAQLPAEAAFLAANPTSFGGARLGFLAEQLPDGQAITDLATGEPLVTQTVADGTLLAVPATAPYSIRALGAGNAAPAPAAGALTATLESGGARLENDSLRVEFDASGDVERILDKANNREVLASGEKGNVLQAFEDRPLNFDAWDIDIFFEDKMWTADPAESLTVIESGPLRAGLEIKRRLRSSTIVQRVYLYRGSSRLDFDTWIDWHEHHLLLKTAFPVNVLSPVATYDIQWGNIERPTHRNTSWDWARFESCAHKWVDLSEGDYGVSLLNDCKYGHDVHNNVLRLTLVKSATHPDPFADQGEHRMVYSLLPHSGDWRSGTVPAGYDLNDPPIVRRVQGGGNHQGFDSLVAVDQSNVIIETVKQAEDGRGIVVRLYENERSRRTVTLRTGFALEAISACNLLEEDESELAVAADGQSVVFEITPYQIVTLRLIPA